MKVRSAILVFALVLLLGSLTLVSRAEAGWGVDGLGNIVYTWVEGDWVNNGVECEMVLDFAFDGTPGGSPLIKLVGDKSDDPLVTQTVKNTSQATWKDWHVDIDNGTINAGSAVVRKVGTTSNWTISQVFNQGYDDGFGAVWVGGNSGVGYNESLSVSFRWTPILGAGTISISQYPTTTGSPIPEPSTILALASCLLPMGIGALRRRSK